MLAVVVAIVVAPFAAGSKPLQRRNSHWRSSFLTAGESSSRLIGIEGGVKKKCEVMRFYLTFDYVENLRNLVVLNGIKEKFCYKKVLFRYFFASRH